MYSEKETMSVLYALVGVVKKLKIISDSQLKVWNCWLWMYFYQVWHGTRLMYILQFVTLSVDHHVSLKIVIY